MFTTLGVFRQLYLNEILPSGNVGKFAVEAAIAIEQVLGPRWTGVEESDEISNVLDPEKSTEVLRRLAGFLTMVTGMLRPLVAPAEEEREARRAAERAEFVISRAVAHLTCHAQHYPAIPGPPRAGHDHAHTPGAIKRTWRAGSTTGQPISARSLTRKQAAFLDGTRIVVPIRVPVTAAEITRLLAAPGQ